jgi:xylulose-5-phosphate/fructose-6-phosphate phosphoketolase
MVVMNNMDRFHLVMDVIDRVPGLARRAGKLRQQMVDARARHWAWTREYGEDMPEVSNWQWPQPGSAPQPTPTQRSQPAP